MGRQNYILMIVNKNKDFKTVVRSVLSAREKTPGRSMWILYFVFVRLIGKSEAAELQSAILKQLIHDWRLKNVYFKLDVFWLYFLTLTGRTFAFVSFHPPAYE